MTDAHCHVTGGDPDVRELLIGRDFFGVHPWEAGENNRIIEYSNNRMREIRRRLEAEPGLGVGEIGLDRLKEKTISPRMRELFEAQLKLALEFRRPVVLHGAKCWGQVVKTIVDLKSQISDFSQVSDFSQISDFSQVSDYSRISDFRTMRVVTPSTSHLTPSTSHLTPSTSHLTPSTSHLTPSTPHPSPLTSFLFHGFSRSDGLIPDIVALNGYISVGPAVLNDHAVNYRELVKKIPADRLLVETDRTEANAAECPSVREVAAKLAELRGLSLGELEELTDANAERFRNAENHNSLL